MDFQVKHVAELSGGVDKPQQSAAGAISSASSGAARAGRAAVNPKRRVDVEIRASFNIERGRQAGGSIDTPQRCQSRTGAPRRGGILRYLPVEVFEQLQGQEEAMLGWLRASPANLKAFLTDPITSLARAKLHLDRSALKQIRNARAIADAGDLLPAGCHLTIIRGKAEAPGKASADRKSQGFGKQRAIESCVGAPGGIQRGICPRRSSGPHLHECSHVDSIASSM
jgi:hypothetical protein